MTHKLTGALLAFALCFGAAAPAFAANKEHQQLAADIRMLQEQAQRLQNLLGALGEALKGVNGRIDDQTAAMRKAFADQKLLIDNLTSDLRIVREKVDDNNVRISSLTQEVDALRQLVQQLNARPTTTDADAPVAPAASPTTPPAAPGAATPGPDAPAGAAAETGAPQQPAPPPAATIGASPQQLYDMAWADYTAGQWDLAVQGFEQYIRAFPKSDKASDAQVKIGNSYMMDNKYDKAVEAYDMAIRTYPTGSAIPEAYFRKGVALRHLGKLDEARQALEYVVKNYPDSDAGHLARQQLDQMTGKG
ncbi:MAG: tetratricopeptide repeat protein [Betaproteobacteria bacterium]